MGDWMQLSAETAYVLLYDLLIGQGVKPRGPAERAVLASEADLRAYAQKLLSVAGAKTITELLPSSSQRDAQPSRYGSCPLHLVLLFSKVNYMFFGYFELETIFF